MAVVIWTFVGAAMVCISLIFTLISFIAPYWVKPSSNPPSFIGLWGECKDSSDWFDECTWAHHNNGEWIREIGSRDNVYFWIVEALFSAGLIALIIAFIFSCLTLCAACCTFRCPCVRVVSAHLIIAFLCLGSAIILFGVKGSEQYGLNVGGDTSRFYWGYWLGVVGALFTLASTILYTVECCRGHGYDGYTRGEVV